ncbi:MAG: hypothetical protein LBI27_02220, partial [Clostridiales bacterium]|nr:hypothetical protein [Clostridiales bacterium]
MVKKSPLNIVLFIFSILAAIAVFGLGELLLGLMDNWLGIPYFLQCAIYLMFAMTMLFLTIFVSEKISSGYYIPRGRVTFSGTCAKAAAIFVPCAFVVGLLTQLLYGVTTIDIGGRGGANFQGTLVVSDISGSMLDNDPDYLSIDALINYVESVPLGEHLGVVL